MCSWSVNQNLNADWSSSLLSTVSGVSSFITSLLFFEHKSRRESIKGAITPQIKCLPEDYKHDIYQELRDFSDFGLSIYALPLKPLYHLNSVTINH
jgi:hypothetical protein